MMIHGTTKIEVTYASVKEALEEWVQRHMSQHVVVKITTWKANNATQYASSESQSITIDFTQKDTTTDDTLLGPDEKNPPL